MDTVLAAYRPSELAAAIHRLVGYRAGEREISYDTIAGLYNVEGARLRALTSPLQARLKLSIDQPWQLASSHDFDNPNRRIRTVGS